jgi:hypothetical protein
LLGEPADHPHQLNVPDLTTSLGAILDVPIQTPPLPSAAPALGRPHVADDRLKSDLEMMLDNALVEDVFLPPVSAVALM